MEKQVEVQIQELNALQKEIKQKKPKVNYTPLQYIKKTMAEPIQIIQQEIEVQEIQKIYQKVDYDQYIYNLKNFTFFDQNKFLNTDSNIICTYSYTDNQEQKQIQITNRDFEFLNSDSYLNDTILNFYLKQFYLFKYQFIRFIQNELYKNNQQYYIFSTYLLTQLQNDLNFNYKKWLKIDIFQKQLLFFPFYCENHWSLFIVLMPNKFKQKQCRVLYLDSLGFLRPQYFFIIQYFLQKEYQRQCKLDSFENSYNQQYKEINLIQILVPKQTNFSDCGLYLLQYVEMVLRNPNEFIQEIFKQNYDHLNIFPRKLIFQKREQIKDLIKSLNKNQKQEFICEYINQRENSVKDSIYDYIDEEKFVEFLQQRYDGNDQEKIQRLKLEYYLFNS